MVSCQGRLFWGSTNYEAFIGRLAKLDRSSDHWASTLMVTELNTTPFHPQYGAPAGQGKFKNGMPREGVFLNEKGFCVARCQAHRFGVLMHAKMSVATQTIGLLILEP